MHESKDTKVINFYDDWGNSYTIAYADQLGHYTWQGRPVFQSRVSPSRAQEVPAATVRPRDMDFNASMPRYREPRYPSVANMHLHPKYAGRDYNVRMGGPMHSHDDAGTTYMDEI